MINQKIFFNKFIPEQPGSQNIMGQTISAEDQLQEWKRETAERVEIINISKHYVGTEGRLEITVFYRDKP